MPIGAVTSETMSGRGNCPEDLDEGRRHLVTVRKAESGRLEIDFKPELGRAFIEASKGVPDNRPS